MSHLLPILLIFTACASQELAEIPAAVTPDEFCDQDFCEYEGWCTDTGGKCAATTQAECAQSQVCRDQGCCILDSGDCVCE